MYMYARLEFGELKSWMGGGGEEWKMEDGRWQMAVGSWRVGCSALMSCWSAAAADITAILEGQCPECPPIERREPKPTESSGTFLIGPDALTDWFCINCMN